MKIQSIPNPAIFVRVTRAPAIRVGVFHRLIFAYPDPNPPYPYPCHPGVCHTHDAHYLRCLPLSDLFISNALRASGGSDAADDV